MTLEGEHEQIQPCKRVFLFEVTTWPKVENYVLENVLQMGTYKSDWFSLRLFSALNISTTTSTVIETVDGCLSLNTVQE